MNQTSERKAAVPIPLEEVTRRLARSKNACDMRKSRDLNRIIELSTGPWAGRVEVLCALAGQGRSLSIVTELAADGLAWDGKPEANGMWTVLLTMGNVYPLSQPTAQFAGRIPFNPHVAHAAFLPDDRGLPPELRPFIAAMRTGSDGQCCFVRQNQWSADSDHDLAIVLWQVSRIVTGSAFYGERAALNRQAADHYVQLSKAGRLPFGPALPAPLGDGREEAAPSDGDDGIDWDDAAPGGAQ